MEKATDRATALRIGSKFFKGRDSVGRILTADRLADAYLFAEEADLYQAQARIIAVRGKPAERVQVGLLV